jgi:predicted peptidase
MLALIVALALAPAPSRIQQLTFNTAAGTIRYGLALPQNCSTERPCPVVLALHPAGSALYYGARFLYSVVQPGLQDLNGIMIAPDCPSRSWNDPASESAVMELLQHALETYPVDRRRILITGFSMGGRGTWYFAARHPDLFTAAIPMASSADGQPLDRLALMPTYIIHSRDDQVVPFAPMDRTASELARAGRVVKFEALSGLGHYEMNLYVDALRRAGQWVRDRWKG